MTSDRTNQMTKTYTDLDAILQLLHEVRTHKIENEYYLIVLHDCIDTVGVILNI